jgi:hypothetical protein
MTKPASPVIQTGHSLYSACTAFFWMGETSGTTWTDYRNGHNATFHGSPTATTTPYGAGWTMAATDGGTFADTSIFPAADMSVAFLGKTGATTAIMGIFDGGDDTVLGHRWLFYVNSGGPAFASSGTGAASFGGSGSTVADSAWHCFICTTKSTGGVNRGTIYIDGTNVGSSTGMGSMNLETGGHNAFITASQDAWTNGWIGDMAGLAVFNTELSTGDVASLQTDFFGLVRPTGGGGSPSVFYFDREANYSGWGVR